MNITGNLTTDMVVFILCSTNVRTIEEKQSKMIWTISSKQTVCTVPADDC